MNRRQEAFEIERSRATAPLFYKAPYPEGGPMIPRPFQHAAVEYALNRRNCLVGDEPGVGKTFTGILISNALGPKAKTLVVCPASLRLNWEREIFAGSICAGLKVKGAQLGASVQIVNRPSKGINPLADYHVVSYDALRNMALVDAIMERKWDHVILDEAHAIKNDDAKRMRAICAENGIKKVAGRFTLLSGTILPNQPMECYNAIRLLDWDAIDEMSPEDFRTEYYDVGGGMIRGPVWDEERKCNVTKLHWSENVRNVPTNLADLQRRLRSRIMIRRLKEQVHTQLPAKQFHLVPLMMTAEMKHAMAHPGWGSAASLYDIDPEGFTTHVPVDGAISTARRELGVAKAPQACLYIEELLRSGIQKLVVAAWHTSVLDTVREHLTRHGLVFMDGKTPQKKRQEAVDAFQKDPKVRIILGQGGVIGEGHTLTAAQDVVAIEPDYVPGRITQLIDRCHRMGQKGSHVTGHLLVAPNTLDEKIIATAIEKDKAIYQALDAA